MVGSGTKFTLLKFNLLFWIEQTNSPLVVSISLYTSFHLLELGRVPSAWVKSSSKSIIQELYELELEDELVDELELLELVDELELLELDELELLDVDELELELLELKELELLELELELELLDEDESELELEELELLELLELEEVELELDELELLKLEDELEELELELLDTDELELEDVLEDELDPKSKISTFCTYPLVCAALASSLDAVTFKYLFDPESALVISSDVSKDDLLESV